MAEETQSTSDTKIEPDQKIESDTKPDLKEIDFAEIRNHPRVKEWFAELNELRSSKTAAEESARQAAEDEALKKGEHEKVIEDLRKQLVDRDSAVKSAEMKAFHSVAESKLLGAGMSSKLSRSGAVAGIPADTTTDTLDAWISDLKKSNPREFEPVKEPIKQPGAGEPGAGGEYTAEQLATMQKSDDRETRLKATKYVRDYRRRHGRYPD